MQQNDDKKELVDSDNQICCCRDLDTVLPGFTHTAAAAYLVTTDAATGKVYTILGQKTGTVILTSFGGKAQPGETPTQTAARELWEKFIQYVSINEDLKLCFTQSDVHRLICSDDTVREVNNAWGAAEHQLAADNQIASPYLVPTFFVTICFNHALRMVDAFNVAQKPGDAEITFAELVDISTLFGDQRALIIAQMSAARGSVPVEEQTAFFKRVIVQNETCPMFIHRIVEPDALFKEVAKMVTPCVARSLILSDELARRVKPLA